MCAINVGCAAGVPSRLKAARNALPFKLAPHGIPLNWIYEGKVATLAPHIRAKLRELQREPVKR